MRSGFRSLAAILAFGLLLVGSGPGRAAETIRIYGPGGPAPAMKEAADEFARRHGGEVAVEVRSGPTAEWLAQAKEDADLIYSGAAFMMTDLIWEMDGDIVESTVTPLYFRPSAILVRPGNPKKIAGIKDLLKPGMEILVVNGAGQTGLWEDIVGRLGEMDALRAFRRNIGAYARNTAEAAKLWSERSEIDAWLVWNIWSVRDRSESEVVPVEKDLRIYRPVDVALTRRGQRREPAVGFFAFLQSPDGKRIFEKWGWMEEAED